MAVEFVATLARIDREIANLMAAHAWCDQPHVPAERGLELVIRLRRYWIERDQFTLGLQVFEQALRRAGAGLPTAQRAEALLWLGQHLRIVGRHGEALAPLSEALAWARAHNDGCLSACCFHNLSVTHLQLGGLNRAREYAEESMEVARAGGSPREVSFALDSLGAVCRFEGRFDDAAAAYEEAMMLCPPGDLGNRHAYTRDLAYVAISQGRLDYARELLIDCIRMAQQYDTHFRNHRDLEVAAHLAAAHDDWTGAARIRGAVDAAADRFGVPREAWSDPFLQTLREKPRQALGEAAYDAAWKAGYALDFAATVDEVRTWLDEPHR
jgi:hypothetical protein